MVGENERESFGNHCSLKTGHNAVIPQSKSFMNILKDVGYHIMELRNDGKVDCTVSTLCGLD